jgi:hypothetical protein
LPALSLPDLDGATVYPDKPVTATRNDGQWLLGRRQQNFAVVPDRAGTLVLPPITLKWWNVQTGRAEEARISAQRFTVLPGIASAGSSGLPGPATAPRALPPRQPAMGWRVAALAAVAALLVLGALLAWWAWRRRVHAAEPAREVPSRRALRAAFLAAARGNDPATQAHTLLAWARAERPGLANLGALAQALASALQRDAIDQLQRRRFGNAQNAPASDLAGAFAEGFHWRETGPDDASPLPPLYPFKLR